MPRGRDQREPLERLVRIVAVLSANPKYGVTVDQLVHIAGFHEGESGREQLKRELRYLERQGWQIERTTRAGELAAYRMIPGDNRFRLRLSPGEAAALQRAALVVKRSDLLSRLALPQEGSDLPAPVELETQDDLGVLDRVLDAVRCRALLRFGYKGTTRTVHPQSVSQRNGRWYLRALEGEEIKTFMLARMDAVRRGKPDTARRVPHERRLELHPMRWQIDEPVDVMLRVGSDFRADVVRWLLEPVAEQADGDRLRMRYRVTNRSAFRDRIYELGSRVEVLGPRGIRAELIAELTRRAEEATA